MNPPPRSPAPAVPVDAPAAPEAMPTGRVLGRFWFRFGMVYLVVYNLMSLGLLVPELWQITSRLWQPRRALVLWVGQHVLRLEDFSFQPSGSGDATYHFVEVWCFLVISLLGGLIWSGFDRQRRADGWIGETVRTALRYVLATTLLSYGMSKLLHQQMPAPSGFRLVEPVGDMSPMGLLWVFVGQSAAYSFFAGLVEVIPALLLLYRRTALLGALASAAVMFHVAALNFCFDVPVKLYSTHLFLFSLYLATPALRPLWNVLVRRRPAGAAPWRISWPNPGLRWAAIALKVVIVANILYQVPYAQVREWRKEHAAPPSNLVGFYQVERFERNGQVIPPRLDAINRWRYVAILPHGLTIANMRLARRYYRTTETENQRISFILRTADEPGRPTGNLGGRREADGSLDLSGQFGSQHLVLHLRKVADQDSQLMGRSFNWINERPFNR